jgi:hypothetical protein
MSSIEFSFDHIGAAHGHRCYVSFASLGEWQDSAWILSPRICGDSGRVTASTVYEATIAFSSLMQSVNAEAGRSKPPAGGPARPSSGQLK